MATHIKLEQQRERSIFPRRLCSPTTFIYHINILSRHERTSFFETNGHVSIADITQRGDVILQLIMSCQGLGAETPLGQILLLHVRSAIQERETENQTSAVCPSPRNQKDHFG